MKYPEFSMRKVERASIETYIFTGNAANSNFWIVYKTSYARRPNVQGGNVFFFDAFRVHLWLAFVQLIQQYENYKYYGRKQYK